ncbi:P1 family peptidase [Aquabacterium sp. OR-4]|uniref:P1 family peptidase n=1 Tax=Aquabacterium sp. OR-4 TaxID=2978127 RepID=UPI0021B3F4F9|nr:P1 family peptidase [Aquabacterium sp. OR-4]MDT7837376.1 P1 family peptidase [Aquabacterium sp. OR-4]
MYPGAITDIAGLAVGHWTSPQRPTGCTVLLCPQGAVAGVDVRGAAPGTRETDLLHPLATLETVHALLLTGGSAFGLDAATGVMRWLEEHGHGVQVGPKPREGSSDRPIRVPIVPAAVLFDLWVGDARIRPDAAAGHAACVAASTAHPAQGSVGAGAGATVGKLFGIHSAMKGGIGTASIKVGAITVAALIAVNAIGDVVDPASGRVIAGARGPDGRTPLDTLAALCDGQLPAHLMDGMATTIGIVATDARLTKAQANKLASMAHDGLARSINPVHTATDGDALFAVATGGSGKPGHLSVLGALAAEVTARAVLNAVRAAHGLAEPDLPSARELGLA